MFGTKRNSETPDFEYFTIYDNKVGIYREPMLAINRHDILRQFDSLFRDPKQQTNQLLTNAEDFSLFKVGEYSKKSGTIIGTAHEHIANLHEIRSAVQRNELRDVQPVGMQPT